MRVEIPNNVYVKKIRKQYGDDSYSLAMRTVIELIQNSCDAGATDITFSFEEDMWVCRDNGHSMTFEQAIPRMFKVTGTHKEINNPGGMMGAAKELLILSKNKWLCYGLDFLVKGSLLDYKKYPDNNSGFTIGASFDDFFEKYEFEHAVREVVSKSYSPDVTVWLNGGMLQWGSKFTDLIAEPEFGKIYKLEGYPRLDAYIRCHNTVLWQFEEYLGMDSGFAVILGSSDYLNESRTSLDYSKHGEIMNLIRAYITRQKFESGELGRLLLKVGKIADKEISRLGSADIIVEYEESDIEYAIYAEPGFEFEDVGDLNWFTPIVKKAVEIMPSWKNVIPIYGKAITRTPYARVVEIGEYQIVLLSEHFGEIKEQVALHLLLREYSLTANSLLKVFKEE